MMSSSQDEKKRKEKMSSKLAFLGGGAGLGLFAVFGVINASFVGGIIGINLAGVILGFPVESTLLARAFVAIGMLTGVMVAGLLFVMGGSLLGWAIGKGIDSARASLLREKGVKEGR